MAIVLHLSFPTASPEPTFRCQISLDKQKQPPYTSTQQKQLLIQYPSAEKCDEILAGGITAPVFTGEEKDRTKSAIFHRHLLGKIEGEMTETFATRP